MSLKKYVSHANLNKTRQIHDFFKHAGHMDFFKYVGHVIVSLEKKKLMDFF